MTSPILADEEIDEFVALLKKKGTKDHSDPTGDQKGDIIVDGGVRNVSYYKLVFICPMCKAKYGTKRGLGIHLKDTIDADHMWTPKMITKFLNKYEGEEKEEKISRADIFYIVVEPREIVPLPHSVEVNTSKIIKKGTKTPTPSERERHDYEMILWRENMQNLRNRKEIIPSKRHKDGFESKGPSGNWWYWRPEIWKQGQWLQVSDLDLKNWRTMKHRTLQLYVICPMK